MKSLTRFGAAAILLAIAAPAFAGPDPEADQLLCDLAGECGAAQPETAAPAVPTPGNARTGSTRGFTFKRQAPAGGLPQAAPAGAERTASAAPRPTAPAKLGMSNLRLTFASGSAALTDADKARLARLAQVLGAPALAARRTRIEGHTDSVGSTRSNRDLSRRRAQSVADYLVGSGIAPDRLEVVGYGSSQPLPGQPAQSPENRRVMAVILN